MGIDVPRQSSLFIEKEVSIGEIENLLEDYEIEIDSPDGWVPVIDFVDKGFWNEYILFTDTSYVRCNENHLFETSEGWVLAKNLCGKKFSVITNTGIQSAVMIKTFDKIPIVDIQIDHPNHRYYTNGVSSHNTNVGKSMIMCDWAANWLTMHYNVLYITLEMSEEKISQRIDANLLGIDLDDLVLIPKESYDRKITKLRETVKGKLIVKEYPTAAAGANHFRALLNELYLKRQFKPDIICVDYMNICASSRLKMGGSVNTYSYVKAIAEELRGLAQETNAAIVTATQLNRSGFGSSDPGLEDTSESFGGPMTADWLVVAVTSEELEKQNQLMIKQLKSRYADVTKLKRFVVGVDRAKQRLFDIDENEQNLSDPDQELNKEPVRKSEKYEKFSDFKFD